MEVEASSSSERPALSAASASAASAAAGEHVHERVPAAHASSAHAAHLEEQVAEVDASADDHQRRGDCQDAVYGCRLKDRHNICQLHEQRRRQAESDQEDYQTGEGEQLLLRASRKRSISAAAALKWRPPKALRQERAQKRQTRSIDEVLFPNDV